MGNEQDVLYKGRRLQELTHTQYKSSTVVT